MTAEMQRLQADLLHRGETVACAESLTGGGLGERFTSLGGSSGFFRGGVIAYATDVKRSVLGVTAESVITAECAAQMAAGVSALLGSTWGVATTGVAGPDPQDGQPVGTVFIGVAGPRSLVRGFVFDGDRAEVRSRAVEAAVALLQEVLDG